MMPGSLYRIHKETKTIENSHLYSMWPIDDKNMYDFIGTIIGPQGTSYEGGIFFLKIQFSDRYPFVPPNIRFLTPIFNPCIDTNGNITLEILRDMWTPAMTVEKLLLTIMSTLNSFDIEYSPPNESILEIYKNNPTQYETMAREWTKKYAID
ncbi:unnamed protein product [Blepharisma stoltei]|uniref:UBC core domain-containing protein n=1 Tax=Blepharisma stoltei TaxID=1481888 RepID=A0AAU9JWJ3_9CILI|nr:unnamed protein product [Blepharisma stoltei]